MLLSFAGYGQQEQLYTQFMYNKLAFNPAYAGNYDNVNFTGIIRNQWIGFPGAPKTQLLSINIPISDQRLGFGLNMTNHSIGISSRQTVEGAYSYRFRTGSTGVLSIGLSTSLRRYSIDYTDSRLLAIDDITLDPSITPERFNRNIINFGGGIYYNTEQFYIGISSPRLSEADLDFDNSLGISIEKRIYYAMTGGMIEINNDWTFSPQVLFKYIEDAPWDMDINASFTYDRRLTAGINYRYGGDNSSPGESIDLMVGIQFNQGLLLGVSYDFTLTKLRKETAGSIEAIVSYTLGQGTNKKIETNPRYF